MVGKVFGQRAVKLKEESEQAIADSTFCERARRSGLVVYPGLYKIKSVQTQYI